MKLFLVRHGHTFEPDKDGGQKEVMLGCHNDLPLVAKGRDYAHAFARYLSTQQISPTVIFANRLQRTQQHAAIIQQHFLESNKIDIPVHQHEALLELDYGAWAGLESKGSTANTNQVIAQFGESAWLDWQNKRIIPNHAPHNWQITLDEIVTALHGFIDYLRENFKADDTIVAVGSQGSISFIHSLLPGGMQHAIANDQYKLKPGHYCEFDLQATQLSLKSWAVSPLAC